MLNLSAITAHPRRAIGVAAVAVLIALLIGVRAVRGGGTSAATPAVRPALTVTTLRAARVPLAAAIEASGAVAAWQEGSIAARVAGLPLVAVDVNVGDPIKKGQVLARFDDATVRTEVAQAEAALAQAKASALQADANRTRATVLKRTGALSDQDLLQNTTLASTTEAQVNQAKALLEAARLKLNYTSVTAPDDGVISARTATLGMVAQAGGELFRFIRRNRLEWRAELNADQVSRIKPGQSAAVHLPDGRTASGHLRQLAPALTSDTRLVLAYVDLDQPQSARAGMYAGGVIEAAVREVTTVPAESVVVRDGRSYVLRLDGNRARQVAVGIGHRQEKIVEIVTGLDPGDVVIVGGAGFINGGDVVRVENAPASAAR